MNFSICVIRPPNYSHSDCFFEIAETLKYGLLALGHSAEVLENKFGGTTIVLGAHLLTANSRLPGDVILYNLEQVGGSQPVQQWKWMMKYKQWDYSPLNIAAWKEVGGEPKHVPIGYAPELRRIDPAKDQNLDALFYGSTNGRRQHVVNDLKDSGAKVCSAFGIYGSARDALIARAKIVLNIHYYEAKVFEIVRVSYLLTNSWPVVSETSLDESTYGDLEGGYASVAYDQLANECRALLADDTRRKALGEAGFEKFSKRSEKDILAGALA